ncbi:MAG TPA: hypothetical protein VGU20_04830 [Stellaceae bacterium]|nr:hypothetical protein [Stellaceae bacterium]
MQEMLVDKRGRIWSTPVLARHYGYRYPADLSLASFAVRERGFIHVRRRPTGVEIALRAGKFTQRGLLAAILALEQMPARMVLSVFDGARWTHELFASMASFTQLAEGLAADKPLGPQEPWIATRLDLDALAQPRLASLQPLVSLWESSRGRLPEQFDRHVVAAGHQPRTILLRQESESKRFIFERVPSDLRMLEPDQWLKFLGRDLEELPDQKYGAWAHRAYTEVLAKGQPQLDSVRGTTRESRGGALRIRYDRLVIPWTAGSDQFVSTVTIRRALAITP